MFLIFFSPNQCLKVHNYLLFKPLPTRHASSSWIKSRCQVVNTFGSPGFKDRPGDQAWWLRPSAVFHSPCRQIRGYYPHIRPQLLSFTSFLVSVFISCCFLLQDRWRFLRKAGNHGREHRTCCNNPENHNLNCHHRGHLKSLFSLIFQVFLTGYVKLNTG
jgi:hypothetical protein